MGELIDTIQQEALQRLCSDCPERNIVLLMKTHMSEKLEIAPDARRSESTERLALDVAAAAQLIATAMIKDEVGCNGYFICEHCTDFHCGAVSDILPDITIVTDEGNIPR